MNRFNQLGDAGNADLSNGTVDIVANTLAASSLQPNLPVKTDGSKQLYSTKLSLSDIDGMGAIITNPYAGALQATSFQKTGGTGIQYLMADGTTLTQSANSGNSNFYLYTSKDGAGGPPITSGTIEYSNAVQGSATVIWISPTTRDGINIEIIILFLNYNHQSNLPTGPATK